MNIYGKQILLRWNVKDMMQNILLIQFLEDVLGAQIQKLQVFTRLFLHASYADQKQDNGRDHNCRRCPYGEGHSAEQEPLDSGQQSH